MLFHNLQIKQTENEITKQKKFGYKQSYSAESMEDDIGRYIYMYFQFQQVIFRDTGGFFR